VHGLMNIAATSLFALSYVLRKQGSRSAGQACSATGFAVMGAASYIGGSLVSDDRIGITHAAIDPPDHFVAIAESAALSENAMMRARAGDDDLLVARQHGRLCALAHACSHLGGPLSEGTLKDGSVVCPWHGSEFALQDGRVLNGPASINQPCLAVRQRDGRIEVKSAD
jgi:nitrite reductase/ring-hydroxylating ferredoxin subunit